MKCTSFRKWLVTAPFKVTYPPLIFEQLN